MFTLVQAGVPCKWVNDSQRLLLEWSDVICSSPSQLYHSALPLCPSSSWLRECYATELLQQVKVVKGLPTEWGLCSRRVALSYTPRALICWKDTIAVGLDGGEIIILDRITGSQTAILSWHTGQIVSLAFSPDGTSLVSGCWHSGVKLWDMQTGGVVKTFNSRIGNVSLVSISADCTMIASAMFHDICLWNVQTEECHCVIQQPDTVHHVRFSPTDPQYLISVSGNRIQQWDINGHQTKPALNGSNVAFSLDGTQLVLCQGEDIVVQNSYSGMIAARFHTANSSGKHCCFSPDGRFVAIAAEDTVYVWDTTSSHPHPIDTFVGHMSYIVSLVFSPPSSLIILSLDNSVTFWQIGALHTDLVVTDPEYTSLTSTSIKYVTLQAEDGVAISCDLEGIVKIWDISAGHCKASFQTPTRDTSCNDIRLINSRLTVVWWIARDIRVWDTEGGEFQRILTTRDYNNNVRISGDGSKLFCQGFDTIQARSMQTGQVVAEVGFEYHYSQRPLIIDGSRVWLSSTELELLGWDFGTPGSPPVQLSNATLPYTKLWDNKQSRIMDAITRKAVFQLAGSFSKPVDSQWDGRYLVAGYKSGEVLILDFDHMLL